MANPFDQFDPAPTEGANPFDAFDEVAGPPMPAAAMAPVAMEPDLGPIYAPGQTPASVRFAGEAQGGLPVVQPRGAAIGRGALQGATMGYGDEIVGLGEGAMALAR